MHNLIFYSKKLQTAIQTKFSFIPCHKLALQIHVPNINCRVTCTILCVSVCVLETIILKIAWLLQLSDLFEMHF